MKDWAEECAERWMSTGDVLGFGAAVRPLLLGAIREALEKAAEVVIESDVVVGNADRNDLAADIRALGAK